MWSQLKRTIALRRCVKRVRSQTDARGERYNSEQAMAGALNKHRVAILHEELLELQEDRAATLLQSDVVGARVHLPGYWVALSRKGDAVWWLVSLRRGVDFLGANVASRRLRSTTGRRERQLATASVATAEAPRLRAEAEETRQAHEAEAAAQKRTAGAAKNADEEATRIFVAGAGTEEQQRFMPEHHRGLPRDRT